ncbi:hypothetical protein [Acetivibrio ethanolgignens]|uniref:Uncharacterized protein n=1 Tax=Acetivibrio ethanolgignens TaxID=290052 RepID=A0A0V8QI63_9FIRM|nr:hypothetical protein [Acetivibrio ethanolgignens]KSV60285.1 hypothetical protein ASU35_05900 [Acetivibrio ethanolgignens]
MIYPCHKVLKAINYLCEQSETTSNVDIMVYFNQRTKKLDLTATIQQLIIDEYITADVNDTLITNIKPTYKGKHYSQYRWLKTKEVLIKSFILPVLVALFTTLITLAVNGFLM